VKPYYQDDLVTIYHGDCREWMPEADVVVTDPPYGMGHYETDRDVLTGAMLASWPNAAVFGYPELLVRWCIAAARVPSEWVVWWPTNRNVSRGPNLPKESEHVAIFGEIHNARAILRPRSSNATGRRIALSRGDDPDWARSGDVWRDPTPSGHFNSSDRLHPNEKPVSLMRKLVMLLASPEGTLLDPFMGSGTTLLAAKSLNCPAIGIEIEERYCEIAATRCSQEVLGLVG